MDGRRTKIPRMVQEFKSGIFSSEEKHHIQKASVQSVFLKDIQNTVSSFEELGNPFMEESGNLMVLHMRDVIDDTVIDTVHQAKKIGEEQFKSFV